MAVSMYKALYLFDWEQEGGRCFNCHHHREHEKNTFDLLLFYITPIKFLLKIYNGNKGFRCNRNLLDMTTEKANS